MAALVVHETHALVELAARTLLHMCNIGQTLHHEQKHQQQQVEISSSSGFEISVIVEIAVNGALEWLLIMFRSGSHCMMMRANRP